MSRHCAPQSSNGRFSPWKEAQVAVFSPTDGWARGLGGSQHGGEPHLGLCGSEGSFLHGWSTGGEAEVKEKEEVAHQRLALGKCFQHICSIVHGIPD